MSKTHGILFLINIFSVIISGQPKCPAQDSCTHPKPVEHLDLKWFRDSAPPDGWHMEIGSKVVRLHVAELIKGKELTYDDDFSNMCGRLQLLHADDATEGIDGKYYGFGNETVDFRCHNVEKAEGVIECDYNHTGLIKYTENKVVTYITYSDNKNVMVAVKCFPNGESGWYSFSKTTSLSQEEKNQVLNHVKALGYDNKDVVPLYDEKCPSP